MKEIQNILNSTLPFVEILLKEYGEFYPLASVVNLDEKVEQITNFNGNDIEFPESTSVLENLKNHLRTKSNNFLAIAIFYNVRVKEDETDAVAVFVEDKIENSAFTFYYAYKIDKKELIFGNSWKTLVPKEIFI